MRTGRDKMPTELTYAIGDVHGCFTQLRNLLRHCLEHRGQNAYRLVFLGDYIDRGRRSAEAVELLIKTQASDPERIICLRGNHDDMAVNAARGGDSELWLANGGAATLRSYGVTHARDIPKAHLDWMGALPLAYADTKRFFVHAGIEPGVPLNQQDRDTLLWIREPFLSDERDHGLFIVHGHTPTEAHVPELKPNRLDLDTGACFGGPLTAAVFDPRTTGPLAFITDGGTIVRAPSHCIVT
jgi:serine/threonine protein phosphatase 1